MTTYQIVPLQEYLKAKGTGGLRPASGYALVVDGSLQEICKTADAVSGAVKRMMEV